MYNNILHHVVSQHKVALFLYHPHLHWFSKWWNFT